MYSSSHIQTFQQLLFCFVKELSRVRGEWMNGWMHG